MEWKIIYVGSASSESYDQVLDSVLVGPVPQGTHKFLFEVLNKLVLIIIIPRPRTACGRDTVVVVLVSVCVCYNLLNFAL